MTKFFQGQLPYWVIKMTKTDRKILTLGLRTTSYPGHFASTWGRSKCPGYEVGLRKEWGLQLVSKYIRARNMKTINLVPKESQALDTRLHDDILNRKIIKKTPARRRLIRAVLVFLSLLYKMDF